MRLGRACYAHATATTAAGLALVCAMPFAQAEVSGNFNRNDTAAQASVRTAAPASLVAALGAKATEVDTVVVGPCKEKREKAIAVERMREENCAECREQLPQLAIVEKQALARCEVKGLGERIADVDERIDEVVSRLKNLTSTFEQQASSNEKLSDEIREGETEAEATFTEALAGQILDQVLNAAPEKQIELVAASENRLLTVKDARRVTKAELGVFVAEMKAELVGKSKAQARALIVARLERAKLLADGIRGVNFASGEIANHNLDKVVGNRPSLSGELLDGAYGALVVSLNIAKDQSIEKLQTIVKYNRVLGYASDTVKIGAVFGNIYQLEQNIDGLATLARAAESQRKIAKSEIDYLVQTRKTLAAQRDELESVAGDQ